MNILYARIKVISGSVSTSITSLKRVIFIEFSYFMNGLVLQILPNIVNLIA